MLGITQAMLEAATVCAFLSLIDGLGVGTNLSRIDRMYISDDLGIRGGTIEILVVTCMFDHYPVMLVTHENAWPTSLSLRIPESIQIYEKLGDMIEHLWTRLTTGSWVLTRSL